ncbi:WXG100 family type VII secretion target [Tessaracoccus sp.]
MSDATQYSQAGLQEGISNLSAAHKQLTNLLEDLKSELSTSLGQWEDNARSAYVDVQRSWDASAAKQQDIVQRMPVLLGTISDGYNATESRNAGIWG